MPEKLIFLLWSPHRLELNWSSIGKKLWQIFMLSFIIQVAWLAGMKVKMTDRILVSGERRSHCTTGCCMVFTTEDIVRASHGQ